MTVIRLPRLRRNVVVATAVYVVVVGINVAILGSRWPSVSVFFEIFAGGIVIGSVIFLSLRSQIEIGSGKLRALKVLGPVRFGETQPVSELTALRVRPSLPGFVKKTMARFGDGARGDWARELRGGTSSGLTAIFSNGQTLVLAEALPRHILILAAEKIGSHIANDPQSGQTVSIIETITLKKDDLIDVDTQPDAGGIEVIRNDDGLFHASVSELGWTRGLVLNCIAATVMIIVAGIFLAVGMKFQPVPWQFGVVWLSFNGLLVLAGLCGYIWCWSMARSGVNILATKEELRITSHGSFGRTRTIEAEDIVELRADCEGMKITHDLINGEQSDFPELQIWLRNGRGLILLHGRDKQELRWIATEMRQSLLVPAAIGHAGNTSGSRT